MTSSRDNNDVILLCDSNDVMSLRVNNDVMSLYDSGVSGEMS